MVTKEVVCMDYFALGILVILLFLSLAGFGVYLCIKTYKNNRESTRKTSRDMIIGIITGAIVALAVLGGQYPCLILFILCFIVFFIGLAYYYGVEKTT